MSHTSIPLVVLDTNEQTPTPIVSNSLLVDEIKDVLVEHVVIAPNCSSTDASADGNKTIYLFFKGAGVVVAENTHYEIAPETILLPNSVDRIAIESTGEDSLHFVKLSCKLSEQDLLDLEKLPMENTQNVYWAKFSDCPSYSEAIKSPNTISRTILSNEYIPRVAMGTVHTKGPDKVAAHEHPMLEQLFLGLSENDCVVYADYDQVAFPQNSILHIPLGSSHSVSVEEDRTMYYVWMDFFLDKKGEEWLNTHKVNVNP